MHRHTLNGVKARTVQCTDTLWMLWRNSQCNAQTCSEWCEDTLSAIHRHCGFKRKAVVRSYNQHGPETLWNQYLWDFEFIFHGPQSKKSGFTTAAETPAAWALSSFSYMYFQNGPWPSWRQIRYMAMHFPSIAVLATFSVAATKHRVEVHFRKDGLLWTHCFRVQSLLLRKSWERNLNCMLALFLHRTQSSTLAPGLVTNTQEERPSTSINPA